MARLFQQKRFSDLFRRFKQRDQEAVAWEIPPVVLPTANWPQITYKFGDFHSFGIIINPGANRALATILVGPGIYDIFGDVSYQEIGAATGVDFRLQILSSSDANLLLNWIWLSRSQEAGYTNSHSFPPLTFEVFDEGVWITLFSDGVISALGSVVGNLWVSQRN